MSEIPVEAFMPEAMSDDQLKTVKELANQQYELEKEIDELEAQTKVKSEALLKLKSETLPLAMAQIGLSEIASKNGEWKLQLKPYYSCKIDAENAPQAFKWLEDNKLGSLIKHNVVLVFDRDSAEEVKKLREILDESGYAYEDEEKVHPQTLKAFIKERVEAGEPLPLETFKAHVGTHSVISKGKKK
jgi:hypothetical protein